MRKVSPPARREKADIDAKVATLKEKREKIIEDARAEARDLIREARETASDVAKTLKELEHVPDKYERRKKLSESRARLREEEDKYASGIVRRINAEPVTADKIKTGDRVKILTLNQNGEVLTLPDSKGDLTVSIGMMKLAVNLNDDESFKRIVNKPARGIGDTSLAALNAAAIDNGCPLMKAVYLDGLETYGLKNAAVQKMRSFCDMMLRFSSKTASEDAGSLALSLALESGLLMFYKSDNSIEGQSRASNVEELLNSVKSFVEERQSEYFEQMQADGSIGEGAELSASDLPVVPLSEYLENVSLLSAVDMEDDEDASNRITLMTVHSSKGLEFPYVYVAGMEENIFPSGGSMASESDVEEERRLFYVAMTRAKKAVQLSFATTRMRNGKHESNSPSRFLREIDSEYIANPLDGNEYGDESVREHFSPWSRSAGRQGLSPKSTYSYGRSGPVHSLQARESRTGDAAVKVKPSQGRLSTLEQERATAFGKFHGAGNYFFHQVKRQHSLEIFLAMTSDIPIKAVSAGHIAGRRCGLNQHINGRHPLSSFAFVVSLCAGLGNLKRCLEW